MIAAVRHAPPLDTGVCYGRRDVPVTLSPEEAAEAILLEIERAGLRPTEVWSSPSRRCLEPATIVATRLKLRVAPEERLHELGFGTWEGRSWTEIEAGDDGSLWRWMKAWESIAPPGGETVAELERRVREWVDDLVLERCHLLVAHAGVIRALRIILNGSTWPAAMDREVTPLSLEGFR